VIADLLTGLRRAVGRSLGTGLARVLANAPRRIMRDHGGISPYLSRWYLIGGFEMPDGSPPFDEHGALRPGYRSKSDGVGLAVHQFHRGDLDPELHSHPWRWSVSLVIAGGYREERRIGRRTVWRVVPPLSLNWISGDDYHRVELLEKDAWTIFLTGPKASSWGFWSQASGEVIGWREFFARKRGGLS
jgi:hypothetical protein